ncbi:MAG: phosphoadenylyl-sulfate reductase [Porticoccaceae bacterium]|nr:phosphoadenylyl-sulfate reductase [Porticoccaceae bacterium]MBT5578647.1 phosphoadenylyl-sulfate reductase [Porticoccaceae bacterium]MBT7374591.1 phosphoadenylyl-sulfate reductase [Porticoccaceae bacterium]
MSDSASAINLIDIDSMLSSKTPQEILRYALENHDNIAISFSGAEDVALVDMAHRIRSDIQVFSLDTGRLHAETYRFIEKVRKHYGIAIDLVMPEASKVEALVKSKGLFSFYEDDHKECCGIRKIAPLRKQLLTVDAWITGQRRDQSPGTRAAVPVIQDDKAFARPEDQLTKFNPLANWTSQQVWDYIRSNNVPYNELHDKGFVSIGCEPCTRPTGPGQHEREGRWWWEEATKKECGLHAVNIES